MRSTDSYSRMDYDLPPVHPFYEETFADDHMIVASLVVLLVGLVLVLI